MSGYLHVGDVIGMMVREYRWWEKALSRATLGLYRAKGREVYRTYTVTSDITTA